MFKQAFRLAFVALIWKQYKALIISTLLLFIYFFLVGSVHNDYLTHLQIQDSQQGSAVSFIAKWMAYTAGLILYFVFHWWRGRRQNKTPSVGDSQELSKPDIDNDPFSAIRNRKTLRGRADFIAEQDRPEP